LSDQNKNDRPIGWQGDAIAKAIADTNIKYTVTPAELLAKFGREVQFDDEGNPHALYDREVLPLADALTRFAADEDGICDRRTLPRSPGGGRRGVASREDLPDAKAKAAYIAEYGLAAFEALPTKAQPSGELKYQDDFRRLPVAEKSRLIAKHGLKFIESLPARPSDQPFGGYINRDALDKHVKIGGAKIHRSLLKG